MKTNLINIIFLAFITLICGSIVNLAIGISKEFDFNLWLLISNFLVITTLYYLKQNMTISGDKKTFVYLFIVYFVIGQFNILIEAYVFNVLDLSRTLKELLRGFIMSIIVSYLVVKMLKYENSLLFEKRRNRHLFSWLGRALSVIFLYIVSYILAGILVQGTIAEFMNFYQDKIPPIDIILFTQVGRGFIFVLIVIFISKITQTSSLKGAILTGITFSILGAIAPLIVPNENMPQYIRIIHSFEVGISNFVFGGVAFYILHQKKQID